MTEVTGGSAGVQPATVRIVNGSKEEKEDLEEEIKDD